MLRSSSEYGNIPASWPLTFCGYLERVVQRLNNVWEMRAKGELGDDMGQVHFCVQNSMLMQIKYLCDTHSHEVHGHCLNIRGPQSLCVSWLHSQVECIGPVNQRHCSPVTFLSAKEP